MRFVKTSIVILITMMLAIALASCSGSSKNQSPLEPDVQSNDLPSFGTEDTSGRDVLAVYDAVIDPVAKTFTVTPAQRAADYHFPLTNLYPNVLQVVGYGWTPNFWADIKLMHPLPGSGIDGFDARVIAIIPANVDNYIYFPSANIYCNPNVLKEPDGYTKLFDELGGSFLGNVNPFVAYFKDRPNRIWSNVSYVTETKRWNLNLSGFGGSMQFKLVVDVSTNFPNPPTPVTGNAPEPVKIESCFEQGLTQFGGDAKLNAVVMDWQGVGSIGDVFIEAPALFNGTMSLVYTTQGPNPDEYQYIERIANEKLAPAGDYKYLMGARDQATGIHIYQISTVNIRQATQELVWAKSAGGTSEDVGVAVATLSDNSFVVTGYFFGSMTFGTGEPNQTTLNTDGYTDIFVARYNPDGTLQWAKSAGGNEDDYGMGITVQKDDKIIVTGDFSLSATFGKGEPKETTLASQGSSDIFVAQYNPDGTLQWAKRAGGTQVELAEKAVTIKDSDCVITGVFTGSATFGAGDPNETTLVSAAFEDIFIARYNRFGQLSWAKSVQGPDHSEGAHGLAASSDQNIFLTGHFWGSTTFGAGEPNQTTLVSTGGEDIFIARYNYDGTFAWAKRASGIGTDIGYAIKYGGDGMLYTTGCFWESATFGPGEVNQQILYSLGGDLDIYLAQYDPANGNLKWAKRDGGSSVDIPRDIVILSNNKLVLTGEFLDTAIFGLGTPNETSMTSFGNSDIFIAEYNTDGLLLWAKQSGGSDFDTSLGITRLSDNTVIATGYFGAYAIFGYGDPKQTEIGSSGLFDMFIMRYMP